MNIPDKIIDRAHRIGVAYVDNKNERSCKSVIVRFTTFRHRTMVYRVKKNLKDNVRVKLDLIKKKCYNLITSANKIVRNIGSVKSCYLDINYRPKVKWSDDSVNDDFFHSFNKLKSMYSCHRRLIGCGNILLIFHFLVFYFIIITKLR